MPSAIAIDNDRVAGFCRRWKIVEFSLFGSVLREDFATDSDIDVLVSFAPDSHWTLLDLAEMEEELECIFGRKVDLLTRKGVEGSRNRLRRKAILSGTETIYGRP